MGEALVWVKVPDLKPGAKNSFWMYFGSGDPKAVKSEDSRACYDADTVLVFHFTESGAPAADATKNANVAENPGTRAEGAIGGGVSFNGKNAVNIVASASLVWSANAPLTISAWVKPGAPKADAEIFSRKEGGSSLVIGANARRMSRSTASVVPARRRSHRDSGRTSHSYATARRRRST
jgi:biopolymer transport protein ExbB